MVEPDAVTGLCHAAMTACPDLNPRLVEALYAEALGLADDVRDRFDRLRVEQAEQAGNAVPGKRDIAAELVRVQASCEALRTTTRVMHCLAWLLNHRAYFAGELNQIQLRRHGRMIANFPLSDPDSLASLPHEAQLLVRESERLYERIQRLDRAWRGTPHNEPSAIERLQQRLRARLGDSGPGDGAARVAGEPASR